MEETLLVVAGAAVVRDGRILRVAERVLRGDYRLLPPADLQSGSIFTRIAAWM